MPYAPPSPESVHLDLPPLKLRPKHRRARSSTSAAALFSDEPAGPGAFAGLPNLPRRRSQSVQAALPTTTAANTSSNASAGEKKTLFHFENEDSDSSDEMQQHQPPPPYGSASTGAATGRRHSPPSPQRSTESMNALGLTVDTKNLPSNAPPRIEEPPKDDQTSSLPFPSRGSPLPSPSPPSPSRSASTAASNASSIPRTPSTPIILSNGKPLKPSLKSSQSSPHMPLRLHARAQSEPSTPSAGEGSPIVKNVHFPDKELQTVRVFNASGRPANVNTGGGFSSAGEETETETEYDSSSGAPTFMRVPDATPQPHNAYPFPSMSQLPSSPSSPAGLTSYKISSADSSSIPRTHPPPYANVHLETLVLPATRPLMLRGSVVVQNVCFAKDVAVRFTLDGWVTTSEVGGRHVCGLPGLPEPFPSAASTEGDVVARPLGGHGRSQSESAAKTTFKASANSPPPLTWDRFSFTIALEDFERKLSEKTLELVVRYTAHGVGEWWDNNGGSNYKIKFEKGGSGTEGVRDSARAAAPVVGSNSQQRTFSAPPTLKGTPTTAEAIQHAVGQSVTSVSSSSSGSSSETLPKLVLPTRRAHNHHFSGPGHQHFQQQHQARPGPPPRTHSSPQPISQSASHSSYLSGNRGSSETNGQQSHPQRPHAMHASLPTKLNLLNYAAPSMGHSYSAGPSLPSSATKSSASTSSSRLSPPPGNVSATRPSPPRSPLAQSPIMSSASMELGAEMGMGMEGGMPASVPMPRVDYASWVPPTASNNSVEKAKVKMSLPPSPPPSYSAIPPPPHVVFRTASPSLRTNSNSSGSSSSSSESSSENEKHASLSATGAHKKNHHHHHKSAHAPRLSSPAPVPGGADSSYAALLKQWCFAQSPSPGASPVGTPLAAPGSQQQQGNASASESLGAGVWRAMGFENGMHGMRSESPMMLAGM